MDIGKNIKIELVKQGMNQTQLQEKTGLTQPTVTKILNGGDFKYSNLVKVCEALGVSVADVWGVDD